MKRIFLTLGLAAIFCLSGCKTNQTNTETIIESTTEIEYVSDTLVAAQDIFKQTSVTTETTITTTEPYFDIYVYKPSTHYIHRSTCHWVDDTCYQITNAFGIEARLCTECKPEIEIYNTYTEESGGTYSNFIDQYSRQLLAEITFHEAGSNWISTYDKAHVVSGVMNRVYDTRFPCTVYEVLTQPGQFENYWPGCCMPTQDCYDAVDYYFSHMEDFDGANSWYGDGLSNHFYYQ